MESERADLRPDHAVRDRKDRGSDGDGDVHRVVGGEVVRRDEGAVRRARDERAADDLALGRKRVGVAGSDVDLRGHAHEDLRAGRELARLRAQVDDEPGQVSLLPVERLLQRDDVAAVLQGDHLVREALWLPSLDPEARKRGVAEPVHRDDEPVGLHAPAE